MNRMRKWECGVRNEKLTTITDNYAERPSLCDSDAVEEPRLHRRGRHLDYDWDRVKHCDFHGRECALVPTANRRTRTREAGRSREEPQRTRIQPQLLSELSRDSRAEPYPRRRLCLFLFSAKLEPRCRQRWRSG